MLDSDGRYLGNTGYFLPALSESRYVLALLNSSLFHLYAKKVFVEKQNGWFEIQPRGLESFPIPAATAEQQTLIVTIVDYILFLRAKANNETRENLMTDYFETIINALVYELFLADELHAADKRFFEPLFAEPLPVLADHSGHEFQVITKVFNRLSARDHPIRYNLNFLHDLGSIRLIEGK